MSSTKIIKLDREKMKQCARVLGTNIEEISREIEYCIRQGLQLNGGLRKTHFLAIKYVTQSEIWDEAIIKEENRFE